MDYLKIFKFFYKYLGYRLIILFFLSLLVGVLDSFGLAMFLPLLKLVNNANLNEGEDLGGLQFMIEAIQFLGFGIELLPVLALLCIIFIIKGIAKFIFLFYKAIVQQFFIRELRLNMLTGINEFAYKKFVTSDVGRIQNTMTSEVDRIVRAYQNYVNSVEAIILVLIYMTFAFFIDMQFALLVTIGGMITNLSYRTIYKKTKNISNRIVRELHDFQGLIIQHITNYKYLKATGYISRYGKRLSKVIRDIENSNIMLGKLASIVEAVKEPILIIVVSLVIVLQIEFLGAELGPILISLLFFYRALSYLMIMQNQWNGFLGVYGSLENIQTFLEELEKGKELNKGQHINKLNGRLSIKKAFFSYEDGNVLKNINIEINPKETVAFVGESGSGKTTLINVLAGLIPLNQGEFNIDQYSKSQIDIQSYQSRIGYITQDSVIFTDSIFNNVTFWAEPTVENLDRFWGAIKQASLIDFVESLPDKEKSLLGNNGVNLSGGQKQRISIARELYKDIDILFMDEATSALDSETERSIQENIEALQGHYTILIIAHRLSTIKKADRIVYMHNGEIKDVGTFKELSAKIPHFKRMVELQEI